MSRVLLITGASSEVGLALIKRVYSQYDVVLAHYCSSDQGLRDLKEKLGDKLQLFQADFTNHTNINEMLTAIQETEYIPDHIVHIPAQRVSNQRFHKTQWEEYERGLEMSLASIVMILNRFIPYMIKKKHGKIIFMLTSYTLNNPPKYESPYIVTKYALLGLMKSLSAEYAEKGIMVNGISPDMMETKFLREIPELVIRQNAANSPLGRNLYIDDVIPTFDYLLSDAANAITGQNIGITGGL